MAMPVAENVPEALTDNELSSFLVRNPMTSFLKTQQLSKIQQEW
jgi:hypothetical protein